MILLPRGNPIKENINSAKVNLPDLLDQLHKTNFTGYVRFDCEPGTGIFIFQNGRLISALFKSELEHLIAYDAISKIFREALAAMGRLSIYRLSDGLAISIHALLHGHLLYQGQELALIDIKSLLATMNEKQRSGCLRIYSKDHIALIFYRAGKPLGFFHDGATEIETSADSSMSVAKEPGAKVDVLLASDDPDQSFADLMETADISNLWAKALSEHQKERADKEDASRRTMDGQEAAMRQKIFKEFQHQAHSYLGNIGASLVKKKFDKLGLFRFNQACFDEFFLDFSTAARMVAGERQISLMLEEMKRTVKELI
jgi:hypothetical protein